jgi:hypothetical protein
MTWRVFKDRKDIGIVVSNLPQESKFYQERANTYNTETERYYSYQLVPEDMVVAKHSFKRGQYRFWNEIAPGAEYFNFVRGR